MMNKMRLIWLVLLLVACVAQPQETGTLEGHVTIGPLIPVSQAGVPDPTPAPEVYAARQIVILTADGQREVARVQVGPDGTYRVTLPVGSYLVDINHIGIDAAAGLPATIEIASQQVTRLDIDIDTGIR